MGSGDGKEGEGKSNWRGVGERGLREKRKNHKGNSSFWSVLATGGRTGAASNSPKGERIERRGDQMKGAASRTNCCSGRTRGEKNKNGVSTLITLPQQPNNPIGTSSNQTTGQRSGRKGEGARQQPMDRGRESGSFGGRRQLLKIFTSEEVKEL